MNISSIREEISRYMDDILLPLGFSRVLRPFRYYRKQGRIVQIFEIDVTAWNGWHSINPCGFVSCPDATRLLNKILNDHTPLREPIFGFSIQNAYSGRGYHSVYEWADVAQSCKAIELEFNEIIIPFFNQFESIDLLMHGFLTHPVANFKSSVYYACNTIILSFLTSNPSMRQIAQNCLDVHEERGAPEFHKLRLVCDALVPPLAGGLVRYRKPEGSPSDDPGLMN